MMYHQYQEGYIEVIVGCMFAGKTEELIRRINTLKFANKNIAVFKPEIDNRYSDNEVVSHAGTRVHSYVIKDAREILDIVTPEIDVVAIDEVQFFDDENSEAEERFLMLGLSNESRVLIICHCERDAGNIIRIISARKATKNERKHYEGGSQ